MLKRLLIFSVGATALTFHLTACSGGDEDRDEAIPTVGDDDDDNGGDSGDGGDKYLEISTFAFTGYFGFDEATGTAVAGNNGGSEYTPVIVAMLGTDTFTGDPADSANYCSVFLDIAGATNEQWATDELFLFGFTTPQGSVTSDCIDKGFDPDDGILQGQTHEALGSIPLGIAVGGDPSDEVMAELPNFGVAEEDFDNYIGGTFHADGFNLQDPEKSVYWEAFEMDGEMNFDFDAPVNKFDISDDAGGLGDGMYFMGHVFIWRLA